MLQATVYNGFIGFLEASIGVDKVAFKVIINMLRKLSLVNHAQWQQYKLNTASGGTTKRARGDMGKKEQIMSKAIGLPCPSEEGETIEIGKVDMATFEDAVESVVEEYLWMINSISETLAPQFREAFIKERDVMRWSTFVMEYKLSRFPAEFVLREYERHKRRGTDFYTAHAPDFKDYYDYVSRTNTVLGTFFSSGFPVAIPEREAKKHTYICAKTGAGKSELIKQLFFGHVKAGKSSVVVIDPHGDLAEEIFKKEIFNISNPEGQRLVYIDPKMFPDLSPSINPFDVPNDEDSIEVVAQNITGVFEQLIRDTGLSLQMRTILIPCISVLLRKGNSSIRELQTFMDDDRNSHLVNLGKNSPHKDHREFFHNGFHHKNYSVTKQSLYTKIQSLLNYRVFADFIARPSTIDLEKCMDDKGIILFNLSTGRLGDDASEAIGRFIVAHMTSIAKRRARIDEAKRVPCHLFVDECQLFVNPKMGEILTQLRKYGLHLTLANQFVGQSMDTDLKNALTSSTNIKFVGMNNVDSLSSLGKEIGVELEVLQTLKVGEFYLKVGERQAVHLRVPNAYRKGVNEMSAHYFSHARGVQCGRFYRPVSNVSTEADKSEQLREEIRTGARSGRSGENLKPKFAP